MVLAIKVDFLNFHLFGGQDASLTTNYLVDLASFLGAVVFVGQNLVLNEQLHGCLRYRNCCGHCKAFRNRNDKNQQRNREILQQFFDKEDS